MRVVGKVPKPALRPALLCCGEGGAGKEGLRTKGPSLADRVSGAPRFLTPPMLPVGALPSNFLLPGCCRLRCLT